MPGWPSPAERRTLDAFPEQIGPEDLDERFKLSPADLRFAFKHRGDGRLGVAVQLCALRWLGFVPDDLAAIPQPALLSLCDQLEANTGDLDGYGARGQTRTDQLAAARAHAGFRPWDAPEASALEAWLTVRAMEHERPKALFTLASEQLHVLRIARPSVDQLVRLIGAARERAHQATFDALADSSPTAPHAPVSTGCSSVALTARRGSSGCARPRRTRRRDTSSGSWRSSPTYASSERLAAGQRRQLRIGDRSA
jgi:hypothetical protein